MHHRRIVRSIVGNREHRPPRLHGADGSPRLVNAS
jgi:hypothetical protein